MILNSMMGAALPKEVVMHVIALTCIDNLEMIQYDWCWTN